MMEPCHSCYVALTGSVSGSVEFMNLIIIDISPILLFLLELFAYFTQRNAHFFLVPILLKSMPNHDLCHLDLCSLQRQKLLVISSS